MYRFIAYFSWQDMQLSRLEYRYPNRPTRHTIRHDVYIVSLQLRKRARQTASDIPQYDVKRYRDHCTIMYCQYLVTHLSDRTRNEARQPAIQWRRQGLSPYDSGQLRCFKRSLMKPFLRFSGWFFHITGWFSILGSSRAPERKGWWLTMKKYESVSTRSMIKVRGV